MLEMKGLRQDASEKIRPFFEEMLKGHGENIHSLHITGSVLTEDFDTGASDINSIVVLREMDLRFLETLAPFGKKYGKKRVSAPLIMTPEYVETSLDVFPIEFLNIKTLHLTVYGEDIFKDIEVKREDLRHQCEREVKSKLVWLRQSYISSQGDAKALTETFTASISGYIPLFRGIISLMGKTPPAENHKVVSALREAAGVDASPFESVLRVKKEGMRPSMNTLNVIFEDYYKAVETLRRTVDEIPA